jgi:dolichyl-diphosphooligosaccharide--protein glycosyltransferase
MATAGARAQRILTPAGLFLLAFAVRALPWPSVFEGGRVQFFGSDAYYHVRRILYSLAHYPASLGFDSYLSFPDGAKPIWTPLFDLLAASLLLPCYHLGGEHAAERAAVWLPPLFGAGTVVALYFLARRHFGFGVAALAGLVLCLLSAHFWYSQVGFVDHHALVSLVATLLLAACAALLDRLAEPRPALRPLLWNALAVGALLGLALLVWPGSLLYAGLVELALLVALASRASREQALRCAAVLALVQAVALLLLLPSGLAASWPQWGDFSPTVLSRFQPWMFGVLTLHALGCAALWGGSPLGERRGSRLFQAAALAALLLSASLLLFPGLVVGVADAWSWMLKEEVFQRSVGESQSIFRVGTDQAFGVRIAEMRLSRFIYLVPVALAALAWEARRGEQRPVLLLVLVWSLVLAAVTVVQKRFFNTFSVALALLMGWSLLFCYRALPQRLRASRLRRAAVCLLLALFCALLLQPVFDAYRRPLQNQLEALHGEPLTLAKQLRIRRLLFESAEWLRANTPPTSGFLDGVSTPEYGVMADPSHGHLIKYVARRPTVVGNFGNDLGNRNFRLSLAYFASPEPRAVEILEQLGVRYILVRTRRPGVRNAMRPSAMLRRLSQEDGPGLAHHRLIYETPLEVGQKPGDPPEFRIFEHVRGARVEGRADPGSRVGASLSYRSNRGREGLARFSAAADAEGRYALVLPYATSGAPPAVYSDARYTLRSEGRQAELAVGEAQVQRGERLAGPDLRSP